jgi:hypothetical protein
MSMLARVAGLLNRWDEKHSRGDLLGTDELNQCLAIAADSANSRRQNHSAPPLSDIVEKAWKIGQTIDLSDISYGPAHWKGNEKFCNAQFPYYFFLAGLVRSQNFKRILEIGTHYGGSARSMLRGISDPNDAKLVTVDITDINPELHQLAGITKIVGDANKEATLQKIIVCLVGDPIDMIYIDADHRFLPTIVNVALYSMLLGPSLVIVDDITLNENMRAMWNVVCAAYGSEAINCADVISAIRPQGVGFGLIRFR